MNCPAGCGIALLMTERLGVQIDYCPQCRGVWLDKGELEKIVERVEQEAVTTRGAVGTPGDPGYIPPMPPKPTYEPRREEYRDRDHDRYRDRDDDYYKKRKKKSHWLGEIFDFD